VADITIRIHDKYLEAVERRAKAEHTNVQDLIQRWLFDYAGYQVYREVALEVIDRLRGRFGTGGRKFTRDEMNERR